MTASVLSARRIRTTPGTFRLGQIPWRTVVLLALGATIAATAYTLHDADSTRALNGWFIHVGADHPSRALVQAEIPEEPVSDRGSHDGAQFYAIARSPFHLDVAAASLDRPRYRLQRPLFPLLAYVLHPNGGGDALVWSFVAVGVAGLLLGGIAAGALSTSLRGPPWPALLFPILPGALIALRITVPDALALAFALTAVTLSLRGRHRWAVVAGLLAVLSKEPMFLVLLGFAVWRRDRPGLAFAGVPALVAGGWAVWLRTQVGEGTGSFTDIVAPFSGLAAAASHWVNGEDPLSLLTVGAAIVVAVIALFRRRLAHPLSWAIAINLVFTMVLGPDSLGPERNGARVTLPLLVLGIVALAAPRGASRPAASALATS